MCSSFPFLDIEKAGYLFRFPACCAAGGGGYLVIHLHSFVQVPKSHNKYNLSNSISPNNSETWDYCHISGENQSKNRNSNRNIHYLEATCHSSITKRNISLVISSISISLVFLTNKSHTPDTISKIPMRDVPTTIKSGRGTGIISCTPKPYVSNPHSRIIIPVTVIKINNLFFIINPPRK